MSQSRLLSAMEACTNVLVGYVVAIASQLVLFPWFGVRLSLSDNLIIGGYFTLVSLARSYLVRRYFNRRMP